MKPSKRSAVLKLTSRSPVGRSARRICVLGAGGFIGSHLVPALAARGDIWVDAVDVTFDKMPPTPERVTRITSRIEEPGLLEELVALCDVVLSLSAVCNPARYNTEPLAVIDANYTELVPVVKLCASLGRRLVHFSTCEVYGKMALGVDGTPTQTMREDDTAMFLGPLHAERWSYACAKQLLERVIYAHGRHAGLPFTIIRPFNVIGPRMDFVSGIDGEGVPRVLASFMGALLSGEPLPLVDGGAQRRSFISVEDFIDGVLRVLDRPAQAQGQVFNLGHPDNDLSMRELALALGRAYERHVPNARATVLRDVSGHDFYGEGYDDTQQRIPDIDKARELLGFAPRTTLLEMLPPIVADYVARYAHRVSASRLARTAQ